MAYSKRPYTSQVSAEPPKAEFVFDPLKIPDRWQEYKPMGTPINDTRIIPVKTPLKTDYHRSSSNPRGLTPEQEFTPAQMVERVKGMELRLVKVIDLTNTRRYYSPQEFIEEHSVQYCKVACVGHETPSRDVYERFRYQLKSALEQFSGASDVVAVHCTHGINRTGYLVCRYLMTEHKYSYEKAVEAFNTSRGNRIERQEYLEHLEKGCPDLDGDDGRSDTHHKSPHVAEPHQSRLLTRERRPWEQERRGERRGHHWGDGGDRSWGGPDRSWGGQERSWGGQERSWGGQERSWRGADRNWRDADRNWRDDRREEQHFHQSTQPQRHGYQDDHMWQPRTTPSSHYQGHPHKGSTPYNRSPKAARDDQTHNKHTRNPYKWP